MRLPERKVWALQIFDIARQLLASDWKLFFAQYAESNIAELQTQLDTVRNHLKQKGLLCFHLVIVCPHASHVLLFEFSVTDQEVSRLGEELSRQGQSVPALSINLFDCPALALTFLDFVQVKKLKRTAQRQGNASKI